MSSSNLDAIRRRLAAATSTDWQRLDHYGEAQAEFTLHARADMATLLAALDEAEAERDVLREWVGRTIAALAFARSVIQCGEPWTATCERTINGAIIND
jgi:hypothetical protein